MKNRCKYLQLLLLSLITVPCSLFPVPLIAQNLLPSAPDIEEEVEEETEVELITDPLQLEENPLLEPKALDDIVDRKINQDVWEELKGELPCAEATNSCTNQLQSLAISNSFAVNEINERIEEIETKIAEARANNQKSIFWDQLSPFLQYYLKSDSAFSDVDRVSETRVDANGNIYTIRQPSPPGPIQRILGDLANPLNLLNNALNLIGLPFLQNSLGGGTNQAQTRAIAIGDLQIKVAQLKRDQTELKQAIRDKVALELINLDKLAKDFQISQEIGRRDKQRMEIIKISYRFGDYDSKSYLGELAGYDRTKATVWNNWAKLRTQLTKLNQIVFDNVEE